MDLLYSVETFESFDTNVSTDCDVTDATDGTDEDSLSLTFPKERRGAAPVDVSELRIGDRLPDPPRPRRTTDLCRKIQCPPSLLEQIDTSKIQKSLEVSAHHTSTCIVNSLDAAIGDQLPAAEMNTNRNGKKRESELPSQSSVMTQLANPCQHVDTATEAFLLSAEKGIDACIADPQQQRLQRQQQRQQKDVQGTHDRLPQRAVRKEENMPTSRSRSRSGSRSRSRSRSHRRKQPQPPACESSSDEELSSQNSILVRKTTTKTPPRSTSSSRHKPNTLPAKLQNKGSPFDEPSVGVSDDDQYPQYHQHDHDHPQMMMVGEAYRSPPPNHCNVIFLVGDEQFLLSPASLKLDRKSMRHLMEPSPDGQHHVIDLSNHSPDEWVTVLSFLKSFIDRMDVDWQTLPVVLPWLVEFRAAEILREIDAFLSESIIGHEDNLSIDASFTKSSFTIPNLMQLTKIAYNCNFECCKSQARRFLRQKLLKPSKPTSTQTSINGLDDEAPEMELAWTLEDLQALATMLKTFDDLRDFLWEYAVIVYLPHDLDIADSSNLVSNPLFPYLLREGMMQMMIVEEMESVNKSIECQNRSEETSSNLSQKLTKAEISVSTTSAGTTCSATTIPTKPMSSSMSMPSQAQIHDHLHRIEFFMDKFYSEKEKDILNTTALSSDESSCMSAGSIVETTKPHCMDRQDQPKKNVRFETNRRGAC